jgi:AcrR family transcriptional regulator
MTKNTKTPKKEKRLSQIIDAAYQCIADKGYENLTMESISEYSGLSRGAINHYFKKKEEILASIILHLDRNLFKLVDDKIKDATKIEDYMRFRLSGSLDLAKDDPLFIKVITDFLALAMSNPVHGEGIRKFFKKYRHLASVGLKPGLENGKYRKVIPEQIGAIALAVIIGIGIQWVIDEKAFDYEKVAKIAEDMIMLYMETKD